MRGAVAGRIVWVPSVMRSTRPSKGCGLLRCAPCRSHLRSATFPRQCDAAGGRFSLPATPELGHGEAGGITPGLNHQPGAVTFRRIAGLVVRSLPTGWSHVRHRGIQS